MSLQKPIRPQPEKLFDRRINSTSLCSSRIIPILGIGVLFFLSINLLWSLQVLANATIVEGANIKLQLFSASTQKLQAQQSSREILTGVNYDEKIMPVIPFGEFGDKFDQMGSSVSIDGNRALVGAPGSTGEAFIYEFDSTSGDWILVARLTTSDPNVPGGFGASVSLSGNRALIGSPGFYNSNARGKAYIFDRDGDNWIETAQLSIPDGVGRDRFGNAVSLKNERAIVGAHGTSAAPGKVVVFELSSSEWIETARLEPIELDGLVPFGFGTQISLGDDRALIGASSDNEYGAGAGSAYVFDFDGEWSQTAKLIPADISSGYGFGSSVSLSGNHAMIAASGAGHPFNLVAGVTYFFEFDGSAWSERAKFGAGVSPQENEVGFSVSLDGNQALASGISYGSDAIAYRAVFLYEFDGTTWDQFAVISSEERYFSSDSQFGHSVNLSDGRILVGIPEDDINGVASGSAAIFEYDGLNLERFDLIPEDSPDDDWFGYSLSVSGNQLVVGAPGDGDNRPESGSVYIFHEESGGWRQTSKLVPADGDIYQLFGRSVSQFGNRILVGAPCDWRCGEKSGEVYVYEYMQEGWGLAEKLYPIDLEQGDSFGNAVILSENFAVIGAPEDDEIESEAGAVYLFEFHSGQWILIDKLLPSYGGTKHFGESISLMGDRMVIGAPGDFPFNESIAYVFEFNGTEWQETALLRATDDVSRSRFGKSVDIFGDFILIGAPSENIDIQKGAAYLYQYVNGLWVEVFKFTASDALQRGQRDRFGAAVDLLDDHALIGAPGVSSAYVVEFDVGAWNEAARLKISDTSFDSFGFDVGLTEQQFFLGAINDNENGDRAGAAYRFSGQDRPSAKNDVFISNEDIVITGNLFSDNGNGIDFDPNDESLMLIDPRTFYAEGIGGRVEVLANGDFTYRPPRNMSGQDVFEYTIENSFGWRDKAQVLVTINPVNDPPHFIGMSSVFSVENSQYRRIWAIELSPGPEDEQNQIIDFEIISNDNPDLFDIQPAIDSQGRLSFNPEPDTIGIANLSVVGTDNGGTENGGSDSTGVRSLSINIVPIESTVDLTVDKTSGSSFVSPFGEIQYLILVENIGFADAGWASVIDTPPARLGNLSWVCVSEGEAYCPPSGFGAINASVYLPSGDSVAFQLSGSLLDGLYEPITNTVTVTAPYDVAEAVLSNNSDSDTNLIGMFADSFDSIEPD